jgi:hypothetical protein
MNIHAALLPAGPRSPRAHPLSVPALLVVVMIVVAAFCFLALPVAQSQPVSAPLPATPAERSSVTAAQPAAGQSPEILASDIISGLWELNEPLPGSADAIIGQPSIVVDNAGNAYALWEAESSNNGWAQTSRFVRFAYRPAGYGWSAAQTIAIENLQYLVGATTQADRRIHSALAVDRQ